MSRLLVYILLAACLAVTAFPAAQDYPDLKPLPDETWEPPANVKIPKGIQKIGEGVADRIDRIVKKKGFEMAGDPWTMQGIPLVFPSPEIGFNLGLKVLLQDIRRTDPDKLGIDAQLLASDKGRYKHHLAVDIPHAFDGKVRITTRVAYDRDISLRYFGVGNETPVQPAHLSYDDPLYSNVRQGPSFNLQILRYIGKHLRLGPILGLKWTDITAPVGSLLAAQRPTGIQGGRTNYVGLGIVYDTLDFEPYPSRGSTYELYYEQHGSFIGSDYDYTRTTFTYTKFLLLHRKLIFAQRTLFEVLSGDTPYYELGAVGGSNSSLAFGGDKYLRGFEENRFIDNIRLVFGFELRWDPLFFPFARQDITVGFVPFLDVGRVWHNLSDFDFSHWHAGAGWGARIIWNSRLIIRGDFAVTNEGTAFYVNLGSSF